MKKFALFLILMVGLGFVACEEPGTEVSDPFYPSPEAVVIDDDACGANSIALLFDGRAAIKAGALSFTSTLTPSDSGEPISITREVDLPDACKATFKNLPAGVYSASVCANYPERVTTEPIFATDSKGAVVKLKVEGASLAVKLAYATSSSLAFTWSVSSFKDAAKDCATAYSFGIYKDAACKELIVSWQTEASSEIWKELADGSPQFEFSGLDSNTSYWVVVKDVAKNVVSDPIEAKTLDFTVVVPNAAQMVEKGGIALAEDFSELVWGANYLRGSAAYSADDRNLATAFDKAEGVNPINGGPWKWYLVAPSVEIGLFSTMKHAVENSRLASWGACNEVNGDTTSPVCGRVGHIKLGANSKTALMCTPELVNLKSVATIEVQFDQALYDSDPTTAAVYVINDSQHGGKDAVYSVTPTMDQLIPTAEFTIKAGRTFTTEKIVLENVAPGARIGIGPIRKDGSTSGSSQHRMYLDNIIVKVVSYGMSKVQLDKPTITSATATAEEAVVQWNKVMKASGYIIEYKESSAEQYTVVQVGNVEQHTIQGLKGGTVYQIRIKAIEEVSQSESEYSEISEVKTLVKAQFPMVASTADEFIAILNNVEGLRTATTTDEIQITANLDFTGKTLPESPTFPGTLVGNNNSLSNITADHAIFASIGSAKDLTIDQSCTFAATTATYLAPLAVEATGNITNVVNKATVSVVLTAEATTPVAVSGLVALNSAKLEGCKNYGDVTYTNTAASVGSLAAGLAAYSDGAINQCENHGKVTISVPYMSDFGPIKNIDRNPIHIAGLVAHLGENAPITNSTNNGEIDYDITHIENLGVSCGTNRPRMGGIVGMAYSDITSCVNNGKIDVCIATSDKSIFTSKNYPANVGGISGGAFASAAGASCSNVSDCVNNGEINCVTYCKGTRPTCGGIVAYPGFEDPTQTNLITRCVNNGDMSIIAFDLIRVGGINGGAGNVSYCKNYGDIKGYIQQVDGVIGGISGFHSMGHKFEYNESYGALSNDRGEYTKGTVELGGLMGQHGNYDSCEGEGRGCVVKCDITYDWSNEKWYGITIGWYDGSKTVVLGTAEEPIQIRGGSMTYSGGTTAITSSNYETYAKGSGSKSYTVHVKFVE